MLKVVCQVLFIFICNYFISNLLLDVLSVTKTVTAVIIVNSLISFVIFYDTFKIIK